MLRSPTTGSPPPDFDPSSRIGPSSNMPTNGASSSSPGLNDNPPRPMATPSGRWSLFMGPSMDASSPPSFRRSLSPLGLSNFAPSQPPRLFSPRFTDPLADVDINTYLQNTLGSARPILQPVSQDAGATNAGTAQSAINQSRLPSNTNRGSTPRPPLLPPPSARRSPIHASGSKASEGASRNATSSPSGKRKNEDVVNAPKRTRLNYSSLNLSHPPVDFEAGTTTAAPSSAPPSLATLVPDSGNVTDIDAPSSTPKRKNTDDTITSKRHHTDFTSLNLHHPTVDYETNTSLPYDADYETGNFSPPAAPPTFTPRGLLTYNKHGLPRYKLPADEKVAYDKRSNEENIAAQATIIDQGISVLDFAAVNPVKSDKRRMKDVGRTPPEIVEMEQKRRILDSRRARARAVGTVNDIGDLKDKNHKDTYWHLTEGLEEHLAWDEQCSAQEEAVQQETEVKVVHETIDLTSEGPVDALNDNTHGVERTVTGAGKRKSSEEDTEGEERGAKHARNLGHLPGYPLVSLAGIPISPSSPRGTQPLGIPPITPPRRRNQPQRHTSSTRRRAQQPFDRPLTPPSSGPRSSLTPPSSRPSLASYTTANLQQKLDDLTKKEETLFKELVEVNSPLLSANNEGVFMGTRQWELQFAITKIRAEKAEVEAEMRKKKDARKEKKKMEEEIGEEESEEDRQWREMWWLLR